MKQQGKNRIVVICTRCGTAAKYDLPRMVRISMVCGIGISLASIAAPKHGLPTIPSEIFGQDAFRKNGKDKGKQR